MVDGRSQRKSNLIQFISKKELDRGANLALLIAKAKQLDLDGFNKYQWNEPIWTFDGGRLLRRAGKNTNKVNISFYFSAKLGRLPFNEHWSNLIKALFVLRFHRGQQSDTNQHNFITAAGYVAHEMENRGLSLFNLTPEYINLACNKISEHYSDGVAYNLHKAVSEFTAYCDANGLCNAMHC